MHLLIFLSICCTAVVISAIIEESGAKAKQKHDARIDLLSNRHISIDQVLAEIMDK